LERTLRRLLTRRELLKRGAIAGAALSFGALAPHAIAAAADSWTGLNHGALRRLRANLKGKLMTPADAGYESARRVWNWRYDRRPTVIVRCAGVDDVVHAVQFARTYALRTAVRSGGHNFAGLSTCDGGMVIDLSAMNRIEIDAGRALAHGQPGALTLQFDRATVPHGLATTMGACPDVGIGGLTLGGGNGWLEGMYGTACDNLSAVQVVTADGRVLIASASENSELYWAMRGAGANFGIATMLQFRLHPIPKNVMFGTLDYKPAAVRSILGFLRGYLADAPDQLAVFADVPGGWGQSGIELTVCYVGDEKTAEPVLRPLRAAVKPVSDSIRPTPYADTHGTEAPSDEHFASHRKAGFFTELSDQVIGFVAEAAARRPSKWSKLSMFYAHGARCRIAPDAGAYSLRHKGFECWAQSYWQSDAAMPKSIEWVDGFWDRAGALASGQVYVNYLEDEGSVRVRAAYGSNYERLAELKRKYDPTNFFRLNQNIAPA
jgi:FAD/FMN-containing dehydrogenase